MPVELWRWGYVQFTIYCDVLSRLKNWFYWKQKIWSRFFLAGIKGSARPMCVIKVLSPNINNCRLVFFSPNFCSYNKMFKCISLIYHSVQNLKLWLKKKFDYFSQLTWILSLSCLCLCRRERAVSLSWPKSLDLAIVVHSWTNQIWSELQSKITPKNLF